MSMVVVAEQTGLINAIGSWVLERACRDRAGWMADHPGIELDVAVNVSARQLTDPRFGAEVARVLAATNTEPAHLVLEITERVFIDDFERAIRVLGELDGLGVRIALDDFGTGYSSLSYLRRMPIQIVKLDGALIADIGQADTGSALAAAVTNVAHVLGLVVVAEGVETQTQRDEVTAMGCDSAQGYFYGRPVPASVIGELLAAGATRTPGLPAAEFAAVSNA
jgi:EAL domain-containing protein (putative c-di-GMP-specific phosphodiesterase class I)